MSIITHSLLTLTASLVLCACGSGKSIYTQNWKINHKAFSQLAVSLRPYVQLCMWLLLQYFILKYFILKPLPQYDFSAIKHLHPLLLKKKPSNLILVI